MSTKVVIQDSDERYVIKDCDDNVILVGANAPECSSSSLRIYNTDDPPTYDETITTDTELPDTSLDFLTESQIILHEGAWTIPLGGEVKTFSSCILHTDVENSELTLQFPSEEGGTDICIRMQIGEDLFEEVVFGTITMLNSNDENIGDMTVLVDTIDQFGPGIRFLFDPQQVPDATLTYDTGTAEFGVYDVTVLPRTELQSLDDETGVIVPGNNDVFTPTVFLNIRDSRGIIGLIKAYYVALGLNSSATLDVDIADSNVQHTDGSEFETVLAEGDYQIPGIQVVDEEDNILFDEGTQGLYDSLLDKFKITIDMGVTQRTFPSDGVMEFDKRILKSPEFTLTGALAITKSGDTVSPSDWRVVFNNTGGHAVTFSSDFDVFGEAPTSDRFIVEFSWHAPDSKVLVQFPEADTTTPTSVILVEDNFSVSPLAANTDRVITNPDGVFSIVSDQLQVDVSSVVASRVNNIAYSSYVSTGDKAVVSCEFYGDFDASHQPLTILYNDSDNRCQIQSVNDFYRVLVRVGGVNTYDFTTSVDIATYPRHKIVLDDASGDVEFFYWDSGWVQMGTKQSGTAMPFASYGMLSIATVLTSAASIQFDNFSMCDDDYTTQFPV